MGFEAWRVQPDSLDQLSRLGNTELALQRGAGVTGDGNGLAIAHHMAVPLVLDIHGVEVAAGLRGGNRPSDRGEQDEQSHQGKRGLTDAL